MNKQKLFLMLVGAFVLGLVISGVLFVNIFNRPQQIAPGPNIACTMEAKICPNGSSVGRTGPNCEFSECPTGAGDSGIISSDAGVGGEGSSGSGSSDGKQVFCTREAKVCQDGSYVSRTAPNCEFAKCPGSFR